MKYKFVNYLQRFAIPVAVFISMIFLSINIVAVHGLQDWWPSLLMNWSNDKVLYKDVHYFTGPLYPVLLRVAGVFFYPQAAAVASGVFVATLFVLSAFAMLNSYARAINKDYRKNTFWAALTLVCFVSLIISRYSSVYMTVADYHTLSLAVYCLVINKVVANYSQYKNHVFWLDRLSDYLSRLPYSFLASLLLLNRFHEGALFIISITVFLYLKNSRKASIFFLEVGRFLIGVVISTSLLYYFASLFFGLPDLFYTFKYVLFIAPEAKGAHESGYLIKILITYLSGFQPTLGQATYILIGFAFYRGIAVSVKNDALAKDALNIAIYLFSLYLFLYLLPRNGSASYLTALNNLLIIGIVATYIYFYSLKSIYIDRFDYSFVLMLSLIGGHVASTSGYYNETFILFLLPSFFYNLSLLSSHLKISRSISVLIVMTFLGVGISIFKYKFDMPRFWWNSFEPSVFSDREIGFGDDYKEKYPNVQTSPTYASSALLRMTQEFCEKLDSRAEVEIKVISYPLPYFESACKTSKVLSSVSNHYVMWFDVSLLQTLMELPVAIYSKNTSLDYVFMQINPLAIQESSKQYWPLSAIEDWPHYKFQEFLFAYSEKNYERIHVSYLKLGKPVVDSEDIILFEGFRSKGCFYMNSFIKSGVCLNYMERYFQTRDVSMLVLYRNPERR